MRGKFVSCQEVTSESRSFSEGLPSLVVGSRPSLGRDDFKSGQSETFRRTATDAISYNQAKLLINAVDLALAAGLVCTLVTIRWSLTSYNAQPFAGLQRTLRYGRRWYRKQGGTF